MNKGYQIFVGMLSVLLITGMFSCGTTQSGNGNGSDGNKETTIMGMIVKKHWTKSGQSYCAQGSDYYVIQSTKDANKEYVIDNPEKAQISKYLKREVKCTGQLILKVIKIDMDDGGQHPVTDNDEFNCTVFRITKISELDM